MINCLVESIVSLSDFQETITDTELDSKFLGTFKKRFNINQKKKVSAFSR